MEAHLTVTNLFKYFPVSQGGFFRKRIKTLRAVDDVTFTVEKGTSFALAGESGSGKTTIARLLLLLDKPTKGSLVFEEKELTQLSPQDLAWYRHRVSAVFQDAAGSLNPRMRIRDIIAEPIEVQLLGQNRPPRKTVEARIEEILQLVGLSAAVMRNFPHELSGGQKQRVAIARSLVLEPSFVILDEPVSSLDVSIRAQILNLLADIQERLGLTYFIIAHDLATLAHVSARIAVMYLGRIVEMGRTQEIFENPRHPYTRALFSAMPRPEPGRVKERASLSGEIGSAMDLPSGCRFHPRCQEAKPRCLEVDPDLIEVSPIHWAACHWKTAG